MSALLYTLTLRAIDGEQNSIHALRSVLKHAKSRGLLAVSVRELPSTNTQTIRRFDANRQIVRSESVANVKEGIMPSARKFGFKSRWIKLEDVHDRPPMRECIGFVKEDSDGKFGPRLVLILEPSGKQLSLNATSVEALIEAFGEDYDAWPGRFVEVYAGETPGKDGKMVDAVLVSAAEAPVASDAVAAKAVKTAKAAAAKAAKVADMNDEIPF